ncbi:hypothetical protein Leryth_023357 [Lithospermum erythrorhizon]|nr:hypothetical protein Leryth_023357 [Lithospermum erythrorhizon]
MVLTAAALQSRSIYFSRKCIGSATTFNAERGCKNVLVRNMRFSHLLFSNISNVCFRLKHKCAEKHVMEVHSCRKTDILGRSKLLNKVSAWLGYDGLDDFIDHEKAKQESFNSSTKENEDSDISLACKRFPSITLGDSPPVNLYDGETYSSWEDALLVEHLCQELIARDAATNWDNEDGLYESLGSLYPKLAKGSSSILNQVESDLPSRSSPALDMEEGSKLESQFTADESLNTESGVEAQQSATSTGPVLDTSINCIPRLSKKQYQQLENCGFHTLCFYRSIRNMYNFFHLRQEFMSNVVHMQLRKLLHHFPRTYADMQNAHVGICDGQYMIFVGEILSSRGIRAGYSFSFLEVVVACQISKEEPNSPYIVGNVDNRKKKTIYLHLKQFFRGTRFTFKPFLQSIQGKYNEGDVVCVSGKVRTMSAEDHYEMREYHIDTLQDEEDSSICAEGKLYPIHPSKGALRAGILRDVISRALKMFPVNFDPIPRNITQEFGLPCLHNAYVGIHQPKNFEEADLARKRLIFDEFFYLQLGKLFRMLEGLGTELERDGLLDKYRKPEQNATFIGEWSSLTKSLLDTLPYALTPSQLSAVSEIIWDLKRPVPMNRLLQGDVGCGKTVVAFLACMEVIGCGYQAAFMVPTELLAIQHYEHFLDLLEKLEVDSKPSVALLTGSSPSKQSRSIRKGLQTGEISLVIGTHSLIAESVEFSALRIAIVDEQHRFGVIQRGLFNSKLLLPPQPVNHIRIPLCITSGNILMFYFLSSIA